MTRVPVGETTLSSPAPGIRGPHLISMFTHLKTPLPSGLILPAAHAQLPLYYQSPSFKIYSLPCPQLHSCRPAVTL